MEFLEIVYWGNPVLHWLIALAITIVVFCLLKVIQHIAIKRLAKLAESTQTQVDDVLVNILKKTKFFILLVASAYVASYSITLKPSVVSLCEKAVILALIVQGGLWASAGVNFWLRLVLQKRMDQDASSTATISLLGFITRVVLWVIIFLLILANLGVNITGLIAGLGVGGIAVALAVQNILGDLLASLSIVLDKPFIVGDTIDIDGLIGTVEYIGLKTTRLRSINGEQLILSNNDLLKSRIRNYKRMRERRVMFNVGVTYQTPLEKLSRVNDIVRQSIESQSQVRFDRVHFKDYGDSSLNFATVYWITNPDYQLYMDIRQAINLEIFRRFQEEGIEFAYPTRTLFIEKQ